MSAVIINTNRGLDAFNSIAIDKINIDIETIIRYNQNILKSPIQSSIRKDFYSETIFVNHTLNSKYFLKPH